MTAWSVLSMLVMICFHFFCDQLVSPRHHGQPDL